MKRGNEKKLPKNLFFSAALILMLALRMKLILLYVPKITHRLDNNLVLLCFFAITLSIISCPMTDLRYQYMIPVIRLFQPYIHTVVVNQLEI